MQVGRLMRVGCGHLWAMRLLPFAAAAADASLTLKRQLTSSLPSRGIAVNRGH